MTLNGNTNETLGYNRVIKNSADANANHVKGVQTPFLTVEAWDKTPSWAIESTGTTNGTTANKLVDTTADFVSDGIVSGMIVMNTTDTTFAIVDAVDDLHTLSLRADTQAGSVSGDVFVSGEAYNIYLNFELSDAYVELNGQTISDADSPWNGKTIRDINGDARFLKAAGVSGTENSGEISFKWLDWTSVSNANTWRSETGTVLNSVTIGLSQGSFSVGYPLGYSGGYDYYTEYKEGNVKHITMVMIMRIK